MAHVVEPRPVSLLHELMLTCVPRAPNNALPSHCSKSGRIYRQFIHTIQKLSTLRCMRCNRHGLNKELLSIQHNFGRYTSIKICLNKSFVEL